MVHVMHLDRCPECGDSLHHSRRRGFLERIVFRVLFIKVRRCHRCLGRFYCPPVLAFRGRRLQSERTEHRDDADDD